MTSELMRVSLFFYHLSVLASRLSAFQPNILAEDTRARNNRPLLTGFDACVEIKACWCVRLSGERSASSVKQDGSFDSVRLCRERRWRALCSGLRLKTDEPLARAA